MKELHTLSPEFILAEMEKRSDDLHIIERKASEAEADFKIFETQSFKALAEAHSATKAKELLAGVPGWREAYLEKQTLNCDAAEAKRSYQRAVIAGELWRSVNANYRKV